MAPLYFRPGSGIPAAQPGKILSASSQGELVWLEPQSKFRGEWAAGDVVYRQDFTGAIPPQFVHTPSALGGSLTKELPAGYTSPPGVSAALKMNASYGHGGTVATTDLNLASLGISGIVGASFWWAVKKVNPSATTAISSVGGVTQKSSTAEFVWEKMNVVANSTSVLRWQINGTGSSGTQTGIFISLLEIYAAGSPYMAGDFVTHAGKMWKSASDSNGTIPGTPGSAWTEALDLPKSSGTTDQRPGATLVGPGYPYFDTTLNLPIWSNGTAWVNASGTVV